MALNISTNFNLQSPLPNFERDVVSTYSELTTVIPSNYDVGHIVYCSGNSKYYRFCGSKNGVAIWEDAGKMYWMRNDTTFSLGEDLSELADLLKNDTFSNYSNVLIPADIWDGRLQYIPVYCDGYRTEDSITYYDFSTTGVVDGEAQVIYFTVLGTGTQESEYGTIVESTFDMLEKQSNKITSWSSGVDDNHYPSAKLVKDGLDALSGGLVFKGTLGSSGATISELPTPTKSVVGHMYKVITEGTYSGISAKVGDLFICAKGGTSASPTYSWILIPSGDEPSGTVTSVAASATGDGVVSLSVTGSPIDTSGTLAFTASHANSGVTAGTYSKVTVNSKGHVTSGSNLTVTDLNSYVKAEDPDLNTYLTEGIFLYNTTDKVSPSTYHLPALNTTGRYSGWLLVNKTKRDSTLFPLTTQTFIQANEEGSEVRIYTRSRCKNGSVEEYIWTSWKEIDGVVGLTTDLNTIVTSFDSYVDNGRYNGIFASPQASALGYDLSSIKTFNLEVINDYFVKSSLETAIDNYPGLTPEQKTAIKSGFRRQIVQKLYTLPFVNSTAKKEGVVQIRTGIDNSGTITWGDWATVETSATITRTRITNLIGTATTSSSGLMSFEDKTTIDNLPTTLNGYLGIDEVAVRWTQQGYGAGSVVSHNSMIWVATAETTSAQVPGAQGTPWRLYSSNGTITDRLKTATTSDIDSIFT